jgi:intracellular multiplication protein IcmT
VKTNFSVDAHWRDSARPARFWLIDYRAAFPILLFLLHIQWWTFTLAILTTIFFGIIERYGFTVPVFLRLLRCFFAGKHKVSSPWWRT